MCVHACVCVCRSYVHRSILRVKPVFVEANAIKVGLVLLGFMNFLLYLRNTYMQRDCMHANAGRNSHTIQENTHA